MSGEGMIAEPRAMHMGGGHARLMELMHRGTEFLGTRYAIMGGAMSWISERNLVSAISNAGGFGVIACGAMPPELLDTEIAETPASTARFASSTRITPLSMNGPPHSSRSQAMSSHVGGGVPIHSP